MSPTVAVFVGVGIGFVVAALLVQPSDCCTRVAAGVRSKVCDQLGSVACAAGDALGLWQFTPGLLSLFGVKP